MGNDKLIKTGQVAEYLGASVQTVRNYGYKGLLKPKHVTEKGTRYYDFQEVKDFKLARLKGYANG